MIKEAMEYAVEELNDHYRRVLVPRPVKDLAVLSTFVNQNGEMAIQEENAVVVSVVNVHEEKKRGATGGHGERRSPIDLNLFVLVAAYFPGKLTGEALGFVSMAIEFFNENSIFSPSNSPGLHEGIHQMSWEIYNTDFMAQSNVWSSVGAKMMPSVMYKVRLCIVPKTVTTGEAPRISQRSIEEEGGL